MGEKKLKDITFFDTKDMFDKLRAGNYATNTLTHMKNLLSNMFRCAYKIDKIITTNPLEDGELSYVGSERKEVVW